MYLNKLYVEKGGEVCMERTTTKRTYTQEELEAYALHRKNAAIKTIKKLLRKKVVRTGEQGIDEQEEYIEPLAIDRYTEIRIQLSWGGDGDGYRITVDSEGHILRGVYYWEDWGVYEEVGLSKEELELVTQVYYIDALLEG